MLLAASNGRQWRLHSSHSAIALLPARVPTPFEAATWWEDATYEFPRVDSFTPPILRLFFRNGLQGLITNGYLTQTSSRW